MRRLQWVLVVVSLLLVLVGCKEDPFSPSVTLRYKVSGTAETVNIDYFDSNGDLAILTNIDSPWEISFSANHGDEAYLYAKRIGETGTVSVAIYVDGVLLDEALSSGSEGATAQGTL